MNYSQMAPSALAEHIGTRLRKYRLNQNKTQEELADITGLARQTIAKAEKGKANIETVMAMLIALDATDHLDSFLPPTPISPIQLAKLMGKQRVRASGSRGDDDKDEEDLGW